MGYELRDVSGATSNAVNGKRTQAPIGVLVHTTAGVNSLSWLQGGSASAGTPASADYLIRRDGLRYRISPSGRYAFHAGKSQFTHGIHGTIKNDLVSQLLIGIELEALPDQDITPQQYESLAECMNNLKRIHGWATGYPILGHYAVAVPMGRRSDPTRFDWGELLSRLHVP